MNELWVDNDSTFEVDRLRNVLFNTIDSTANIELTIYEDDGLTPVAGEAWPKQVQGIGNGRYVFGLGIIQLTEGNRYIATFLVTGSNGEKARWDLTLRAKVRNF